MAHLMHHEEWLQNGTNNLTLNIFSLYLLLWLVTYIKYKPVYHTKQGMCMSENKSQCQALQGERGVTVTTRIPTDSKDLCPALSTFGI